MKPIYKCRVCGAFIEEPFHCGVAAELLLDSMRRVALSKLMSFLLRHDPSAAGLSIDPEGWVSIEDLTEGIKHRWRNAHLYKWVEKEHIIAIAILDPKGRFELKDNMIRARYGHNKNLKLCIAYPEDRSTRVLYHGTAREYLSSILREGIKPMKRHFVHLSLSSTEACEVGRRHSQNAVVLLIDADCVRRNGIAILVGSHRIRLARYIPPQCILKILSYNDVMKAR